MIATLSFTSILNSSTKSVKGSSWSSGYVMFEPQIQPDKVIATRSIVILYGAVNAGLTEERLTIIGTNNSPKLQLGKRSLVSCHLRAASI